MLLKIILAAIIIMALAFLGLGIQTFFSKRKKFPEIHIGQNKEMRKRNIYCVKTEQKIIDKQIAGGLGSCGCAVCDPELN